MSNDENTLGGRVRRYSNVTRTVGGLALQLAGNKAFGRSLDKDRHAGELRAALGGLKGPLMKVAQLLATIPEALPAEYARELSQLQADAPAMGQLFVRRRMRGELGMGWEKKFGTFELEAAHAASLGQVHKGTLLDGQPVACKLQYPDIASAVEADLQQLRMIFALYRRYDPAINPERIYDELAERLREELDYRREAKHIRLYRAMLETVDNVYVPDVVEELSTDRLLTMSWLEGKRFISIREASLEKRNLVAERMMRAWYVPFYRYGVIHGDPHLGNYNLREDGSVNLLDFGCVRIFPTDMVAGVIELYWALLHNDRDRAAAAYNSWGFPNLTNELLDILNEWAGYLYSPLLKDEVRTIYQKEKSEGARIAGGVLEKLKKVGGVTPPREFVFMDRAAIGLGSVFMHLDAEVNWHRIFMSMIEDFGAEVLAKRQSALLEDCGLESPPPVGS